MNIFRLICSIFLVSLLCACAGPRYLGSSSLKSNEISEVIIVEDAETRKGFLVAIESWLKKNKYTYKVVKDGSKYDFDKLNIEYVGHWKWDLALFLSQAKIEGFYKGERISEVIYKASNNFNFNKYSDAKERINYMMEILFGNMSSDEATKAIKSENL